MTRQPDTILGPYRIQHEPPTAMRTWQRWTIWRGHKFIGALCSVPDRGNCEDMERRNRQAPAPDQAIERGTVRKYWIGTHRTAKQNKAAKEAALDVALTATA